MSGRSAQHELPTGVGLGLRWDFLEAVLESEAPVPVAFFEVSPENYMRRGGYYPAALERVRERHRLVTHGLTLSVGAVDPPADDYLDELRRETLRLGTPFHSDHLCLSTAGPRVLHELLPLKLSLPVARRVADRIRAIEDRLALPMAVENVSWYAHPARPEVSEAEFIREVLERADCRLLLDVNNVYVNAQNHGFDPRAMIAELPLERVAEIHVAGHTRLGSGMILDTHGAPVVDPVLELLEWTIARTGPAPVLLERDNSVPPLTELLAEVQHIDTYYQRGVAAWTESGGG